jgi:large subunit ribosomal protein L21
LLIIHQSNKTDRFLKFDIIPAQLWNWNGGDIFMLAIIESCGKQYSVEEGVILQLDSYQGNVKDEIVFDRVLLYRDEEQVVVGRPYVEGAKVKGIVLRNGKGKKVSVFKYKPKIKYRRFTGHRQRVTLIKIQSIES